MFDSADDFKYADVSRIAIDGVGTLPERKQDGRRAMCAKDTAFACEAFYERSRIRTTDDSSFEKVAIGILAWGWWTTIRRIGSILGTEDTDDSYVERRWWHYAGFNTGEGAIDTDPIDPDDEAGMLYDALRKSETARVHIPRNRDYYYTEGGAVLPYPMTNPLVWLQDEYYAIKMADATCYWGPEVTYSGNMKAKITTITKTWNPDEQTWETTTDEYTSSTDTITYVHQLDTSDTKIVDTTIEMASVDGTYFIKYDVKCPDLVERATLVFRAFGVQENEQETAYDKHQLAAIELTPSSYSTENGTVTFSVPAAWIAKLGGNLPTELPGSLASSGTRFVRIDKDSSPELAVLRFKLRTNLDDVDWDYEPDDGLTIP